MVSTARMFAGRVSLPRPLVGGLLCAALIGATSWAVLASGWVSGGGGAVVVAVTAVLEAALLAWAAVPRMVGALVIPVLALAAIVPTTLAAIPFDGDASVRHTAARYLAALVGGLASNTDWTFTVGLCTVLWACGYWLGWMALREHRGVVAVVPLYAVLATNVLNAKAPDAVALPEVIAAGLSLLVIAESHLDALQFRWASRRVAPLAGTRSRFAMSVAVVAVVLSLLALVLPPLTTVDISARFFPGAGNAHSNDSSGNPVAGPGTIQFNAATQPGGALVSNPKPVLVYHTENGAAAYLRVVNDTVFLAGDWFPDQLGSDLTSTRGVPAGPILRDRSVADGGVGRAQRVVSASISLLADATGGTALVMFPGDPDALSLDASVLGTMDPAQTTFLTVDQVRAADGAVQPGNTIIATGLASTATTDQLRGAGNNYPDFVGRYTQFPNDPTHGLDVITSLARQWTAGTTNAYDAASAIELHLRDPRAFTYTLSPPHAPNNEWSIVYFLTSSHTGYCQYFASAMGAMLRSLNIPTRLVSGYGPGVATTSEAPRQGAGQQVVTTSDAHTWVEAYFPGYGWVPFEPTPPSTLGNYTPFSRGANGSANLPGAGTTTPQASPNTRPGFGEQQQNNSAGAGAARMPAALFGLIVGAGAVLLAAVVLLVWLMLPRSLPGAWRRTEAMGAWAGIRRKPAETHREYASRFAALRPRSTAQLLEIASVSGRAEFSKIGAARADRRRALRRWRRLVFSLLRARRWRHAA